MQAETTFTVGQIVRYTDDSDGTYDALITRALPDGRLEIEYIPRDGYVIHAWATVKPETLSIPR